MLVGYSLGAVSPSSLERFFQNVATPTALAINNATALLFGFFDSGSIVGTASFAFFFRTRLPTIHVTQPTAAFLRLKTPTRRPYKKKRAPPSAARAGPWESAGNLRAGEAPGGTRARPEVKTPAPPKTCMRISTLRSAYVWHRDRLCA